MKFQQVSRFRATAVAVAFVLAGCQTQPMGIDEMAGRTNRSVPNKSSGLSPAMADAAARAQGNASPDSARIYKGTGVVVKGMEPGGKLPAGPAAQPAGGGVILNFEAADLREVVRNILGDILNENYTIDPAVGGSVTIRTSTGIPRDALTATLETLLRANGATMVKNGGLYPGRAAGRGRARQHGAAARQFDACAAVGIFGADRSAALRGREGNDAAAGAFRQGRAGGAR